MTKAYEKLGAFYLGKAYDLATSTRLPEPVLYDSKDLVTHAVCVGMTGSGKTGLCLALLEEAAIDGIPSIIIDPKGDLGNLLLTFPDLSPASFRPWINEEDAARKGVSPDDFAARQAALWTKGIAEWDQDAERIARLRSAADFVIYTPASTAGIPVSIVKSFAAPAPEFLEDAELFKERVSAASTSLLTLLGLNADPLKSREHILISSILAHHWQAGQDLDIAALIGEVQKPPMARIGVMEIESFYPSDERFALAMRLNNLIASPGFSRWLEGEALDVQRLLYTPEGKPRCAIFSIAHLGDAERMFFVSLLLNQVLGWVRTQSGTSSLRAILYMDEIAGYVPPIANPPSKQPLLTLMKQARAFGLGVVLATQNPVDLDYKGLSNAGTWFLGRLQTDRDKQRVLDGLEGVAAQAGGGLDRAALDRALSGLGPRVFVMNNIHDAAPTVLESRWCLSYLRGPLNRQQIKSLMEPHHAARNAAVSTPTPPIVKPAPANASTTAAPQSAPIVAGDARPEPASAASGPGSLLPPGISSFFVASRSATPPLYVPMLLGLATVYYDDRKSGFQGEVRVARLCPFDSGPVAVDWTKASDCDIEESDLEREGRPGATFASLVAEASRPRSYDLWRKAFAESLFRSHEVTIFAAPDLEMFSNQGESEAEFRVRLGQRCREVRDQELDALRAKYGPRVAALQEKVRLATLKIEEEKRQAANAKVQSAFSIGGALLGALLGRKVASATNLNRAASGARAIGRSAKESSDIARASERADTIAEQLDALQAQFESEAASLASRLDPTALKLERVSLKPRKSNVSVRSVALVWMPHESTGAGPVPAW